MLDEESRQDIVRRVFELFSGMYSSLGRIARTDNGDYFIFASRNTVSYYSPLKDIERIVMDCDNNHPDLYSGFAPRTATALRHGIVFSIAAFTMTAFLFEIESQFTGAADRSTDSAGLVMQHALRVAYETSNNDFPPETSIDFRSLRKQLLDLSAKTRRKETATLIRKLAQEELDRRGARHKLTNAHVRKALRELGAKATREAVAERLDVDVDTVDRWREQSKFRTWPEAKAALLKSGA